MFTILSDKKQPCCRASLHLNHNLNIIKLFFCSKRLPMIRTYSTGRKGRKTSLETSSHLPDSNDCIILSVHLIAALCNTLLQFTCFNYFFIAHMWAVTWREFSQRDFFVNDFPLTVQRTWLYSSHCLSPLCWQRATAANISLEIESADINWW